MAADLTHYRMEAMKLPAKAFAQPLKKKMALYLNRGEYNSFLISALCVVLSCFLLLYASFPSGMAITTLVFFIVEMTLSRIAAKYPETKKD